MGAIASQLTSLTIALLNRWFRRWSNETSKLRVTSLCEGNSPVTGEFPAQRASNAENVSIDDVIMSVWEIMFQENTFEVIVNGFATI